MGNGCEKCCSNTDEQSDLTFDPELPVGTRKKSVAGVRQSREFTGKGIVPVKKLPNVDIAVIVRLQARVRGFLARRKYKVKTGMMQMSNGIYFKQDEYKETLGMNQESGEKSV